MSTFDRLKRTEEGQRFLSARSYQEAMQVLEENPDWFLTVVMGAEFAAVVKAVDAFVSADTWAECKRVVTEHPELLTDVADGMLADFVRKQEDPAKAHILEGRHRLLVRCRAEGIEAVFGN